MFPNCEISEIPTPLFSKGFLVEEKLEFMKTNLWNLGQLFGIIWRKFSENWRPKLEASFISASSLPPDPDRGATKAGNVYSRCIPYWAQQRVKGEIERKLKWFEARAKVDDQYRYPPSTKRKTMWSDVHWIKELRGNAAKLSVGWYWCHLEWLRASSGHFPPEFPALCQNICPLPFTFPPLLLSTTLANKICTKRRNLRHIILWFKRAWKKWPTWGR